MDEFRGIRVITTGSKYQTEQGFTAIKNGVKARDDRRAAPSEPKPPWLKARLPSGERFENLRATVRAHRLATVCEESICPNIGECWNNGTATLMLMGAVCTRACQFCAVDTGNPRGWLDPEEIQNSARTVRAHESQVRRADVRRSRRFAGRRRGALRRLHPRDQGKRVPRRPSRR